MTKSKDFKALFLLWLYLKIHPVLWYSYRRPEVSYYAPITLLGWKVAGRLSKGCSEYLEGCFNLSITFQLPPSYLPT